MVSSDRFGLHLSKSTLFYKIIYFSIYKNEFPGEKNKKMYEYFFSFFLNLIPNFSDFVNSDDCIGKLGLKSITLYSVFILKRFEVNKK